MIDTSIKFPLLLKKHLNRCFQIRYGNSIGTCFLHSANNKVAFATAKHIIKNLQVHDNVALNVNNEWILFEVKELLLDDKHDCAVFSIDNFQVSDAWSEEGIGLVLGHPTIYLGFPHGLTGDYPVQLGSRSPLAKVAHFSGNIDVGGVKLTVLDGVNNPGFSGGPIFAHGLGSSEVSVIGLINGYRFEQPLQGQVFKNTPSGDHYVTDMYVKLNSGIIYATPILAVNGLFEKIAGLDVGSK